MTMRQREQQLLAKIAEKSNEAKAIWDKVGDAPIDEATKKTATDIENEIGSLEAQVKDIREQMGMYEANERRQQSLSQPADNGLPTPNGKGHQSQQQQLLTLGDQLMEDAEFKAWRERVAGKGAVSRAQFGNSPAIMAKTLITGASSTSAGAMVVNERLQIVDQGTVYRPINVLDLITRGRTGSDTVEYVRQGTHTNNAATVAEATATSGSTGSKPESAMVFAIVSEAVKTIAHWIPASRRSLADAAQLRSLIDSFLRYGLQEETVDQVLNGDGVGENFTGIYNTTGTTTQAWDTNILTTTRKARTLVMTTGRATPTAYVFHPTDWQTIDLLQDNEARYYFGGPSAIGNPRLWGLPVVEDEANTAGYGLVADWKLAMLWDREQAQILVSDSHSDFFIRNLIALLAEMRAAFGVIRPAAFVEIDLTA